MAKQMDDMESEAGRDRADGEPVHLNTVTPLDLAAIDQDSDAESEEEQE